MGESIITSATQQQTAFARPHGDSGGDYLPAQIPLNVRGQRFVLDRETINHLPDSLLNTMFPNGLMHLGRGYDTYGYDTGDYYRHAASGAPEQTWVDFDPDMLAYVLQAYGRALDADLLAVSDPVPGAGPESNSSGGAGGHSDTPDDSHVWLNYASNGKASVAGAAGAAGAASGAGSGSGGSGVPPKGETNNDSLSTFTDTGSHVNNSSSGATQSTSSSAVLNYMRFVSGAAARGGRVAGGYGDAQVPQSSIAYQDSHPLVVLREELDYFVVPSSGRTRGDISGVPDFTLDMAKTRCGELLIEDDSVFEPLERTMQRNLEKWRNKVNAEGASDEAHALQSASIIEQQLIDMLCLAGFPRDARWGCRRVEPSKTSVTSLLTVPLDESADQSRMVAAQKLLLFYKKPARKCWWEGEDVNAGDSDHKIDLKLWCRRTWTLELVLV
ncbi:hypothetical protein H4R19_002117 [Coemansia spiralis]|nr:hypothetical protein H4R19_002117 [Coemansia spiralis]